MVAMGLFLGSGHDEMLTMSIGFYNGWSFADGSPYTFLKVCQ
jgi:hypothetical protein